MYCLQRAEPLAACCLEFVQGKDFWMEREFETKKKRILQELLKHRYAHRGFHRKPAVPENSMDAFKRAGLNGFGIELDIHLTKDGKLAVIHDASLKRTCGADLNIEEITLEEAQKYFLEESQEVIPDFDHVLKLIDGYVPLVVELKVEGGNEAELCERALRSLDRYDGLYCVESFDPRAIMWLRRNRPDIVRGQLAGALKKDGFSISSAADFMLRNLWVNFLGKPDFVAYKFENRENKAFMNYKGAKFFWTIRSYGDMKEAEDLGCAPIFEKFDPRDYE